MMDHENDAGRRFHVVGAGLAGLSAATVLAEHGYDVTLYESSPHAGGRCRSYYDTVLDRHVDNGNHLFLRGNHAVNEYVNRIGSAHLVTDSPRTRLRFWDCTTRRMSCLDAGAGVLPWPLLLPKNRPDGVSLRDLLQLRMVSRASPGTSVETVLSGQGEAVYCKLWEPLAVAVLNTPASIAEARLLAPVLKHAFHQGARSSAPRMATTGLSDTFVSPAIRYLQARRTTIRFNHALKGLNFHDNNVSSLSFSGEHIQVSETDGVVLAVPPWVLKDKIPSVTFPDRHNGIANIHFVLPAVTPRDRDDPSVPVVGVINGYSHWIFVREDVASVTISAVNDSGFADIERNIGHIWQELCDVLGLGDAGVGNYRIIREKRATIAHTAENISRRPVAGTRWRNLALAGDWTETGLPATIEGAIRSGKAAAEIVQAVRPR